MENIDETRKLKCPKVKECEHDVGNVIEDTKGNSGDWTKIFNQGFNTSLKGNTQ